MLAQTPPKPEQPCGRAENIFKVSRFCTKDAEGHMDRRFQEILCLVPETLLDLMAGLRGGSLNIDLVLSRH